MINTLEQLNAKKAEAIEVMTKGADGSELTRVVVGLATCGIAAGANPVYQAILTDVEKLGLENISVCQTGCIGMCQFEPIVEIVAPGKEKVTYVQMTAEKAQEIVAQHLAKGQVVAEYTVGAVTQ